MTDKANYEVSLTEKEVKLVNSAFASYLASLKENLEIAELCLEGNPDHKDAAERIEWHRKEIDSLMELASKIDPI